MTTKTFTVEVPYLKTRRPSLSLVYSVSPVRMSQARFAGRLVATPQIDLSMFSCRAVIDFVAVKVTLSRQTQFRFIQEQLTEILGERVSVKPFEKRPGSAETRFVITFQEPDLSLVERCLDRVRDCFGFDREPEVHALEVSVDFRPQDRSEADRHRIFAVLARHLHPDTDILTKAWSRPRIIWSDNPDEPKYLVGKAKRTGLDLLRWPLADLRIPADATVYAGQQYGRAQWKVMDKYLDKQNRSAGTRLVLPENERRARVEVTLNRDELRSIGIESIQCLSEFSFTRLQGRYFQFVLPTFAQSSNRIRPAVARVLEENRHTRFRNSGVLGLIVMDEATRRFHADNRKAVARTLRTLGLKISSPARVGAGSMTTYVKYVELNGRVSNALEKLGERIRRGRE